MDITIDSNIFNVHKCTIREYVTNLQIVISYSRDKAIIDSKIKLNKDSLKLSLRMFIGGSNSKIHKMMLKIMKINMNQKKMTMTKKNTRMKNNSKKA